MNRVNLGCGQTPIKGWRNFDNSLSIRLAKIPSLPTILLKLGLLKLNQYQFIYFARVNDIEYGDVTKGLPLQNESINVIYSSHMLEHLDQAESDIFLKEAYRVLIKGGIIRLVVPDIRKQVEQYVVSGDADTFVKATSLWTTRPKTIIQRLRLLLAGFRHHLWMYDGKSLSDLLEKHGFVNPKILPPGETSISNYDPLDLFERSSESIYVEAEKR